MLENIKVLVLNYSFEPLNFCTAKRAIVMLFTGRAKQVECDGIMVRTFTRQFPCPTVIRLNRYIRLPYSNGVAFNKKNVMRRDGHACQYCGKTHKELTLDHIIPRSLGGKTNWLNVVAACRICNTRKGHRNPEEVGMKLMRKPFRPKFMALLLPPHSATDDFKASWSKYLAFAQTEN